MFDQVLWILVLGWCEWLQSNQINSSMFDVSIKDLRKSNIKTGLLKSPVIYCLNLDWESSYTDPNGGVPLSKSSTKLLAVTWLSTADKNSSLHSSVDILGNSGGDECWFTWKALLVPRWSMSWHKQAINKLNTWKNTKKFDVAWMCSCYRKELFLTSRSVMNCSIRPVFKRENIVWATFSACRQLWYLTGR